MKKTLIGAIALAFTFLLGSTSFAAKHEGPAAAPAPAAEAPAPAADAKGDGAMKEDKKDMKKKSTDKKKCAEGESYDKATKKCAPKV